MTHRTNIRLGHFIYHTLKYSSSTYISIKKANEFKFEKIKKDNMYLRRITVKFGDWHVSLKRNKLYLRIQAYFVVKSVVAISPRAVNRIPSGCVGDDV
jgi:hypothetical protein